MKESIGGISLFNIVIFFVLVFTGYISLSINYSKAYNIKNEIVNIIKNQGGVCTSDIEGSLCYNFKDQITDYFREAGYRARGTCDDDWVGYTKDGDLASTTGNNAAFCVKGINAQDNPELPNALYYQVKIFFQLDLPIIREVVKFDVDGETARVFEPNECTLDSANYPWCS